MKKWLSQSPVVILHHWAWKKRDGVGGLVKHQALLHKLTEIPENAIQTVQCKVSALSQKLKAVNLTPLGMDKVVEFHECKNEDWVAVHAFPGIQTLHARPCQTLEASICELHAAQTIEFPCQKPRLCNLRKHLHGLWNWNHKNLSILKSEMAEQLVLYAVWLNLFQVQFIVTWKPCKNLLLASDG